jgi:hypothetical protein
VPHLDPERLVLIALGEQDPSAPEREHLRACAECGADLDATRAAVTVGRQSEHVRDLPAPPEDLWARIAGSAFAARPTGNGRARQPPARNRPSRGRRRLMVVAAAVVIFIAAAGAAITWTTGRGGERVVAEADLVAQPGAPAAARGRATIVDTGHGLQMRVAMSGMPTPGGYYTVWLFDGRTVMIPIGSPGPAPLNVPTAADDLTTFSIVDISAQRLGQQQHGTSMLQGHLHPA